MRRRSAHKVHGLLTRYGFLNAESILDEWDYAPAQWNKIFVDPIASREYFDSTQDSFGAAFDATVMTELQDAPVDIATFFSGTTFMWGLFTSAGGRRRPTTRSLPSSVSSRLPNASPSRP